jgi:hypothetical protein
VLTHDVSYTTTGTKPSVDFDPAIAPFNVSVQCTLSNTGTYKLQYTLDSFENPLMADADANWIDSTDIPNGTATSAGSSLSFPVSRVRVIIAAISGTLRLQTQQGMSIN